MYLKITLKVHIKYTNLNLKRIFLQKKKIKTYFKMLKK